MKFVGKIFTTIFFALAAMPVNVFAALPEGGKIDQWMNQRFCAKDSKGQMSCDKDPVFQCRKYNDKFKNNRLLFDKMNNYLKMACRENNTSIFSHIHSVVAFQSSVSMVECEIGYVHPTGVPYANIRCVPVPNYSKTEHEQCIQKGCKFQQYEHSGSATYECKCKEQTEQSNRGSDGSATIKRTKTTSISDNGASDSVVVKSETVTLPREYATNSDPVYYQEESEVVKPEVATLPKEANINSAPVYYNGGATNNDEYAEQLREKWEVVEPEKPVQPLSTDNDFDFMEQQRKDRSSTTSALSAQPKDPPKSATAPKPKATINDQASTLPESVKRSKQEILASVGNIKIGDSITYNDSDYKKYLEPAVKEWKAACAGIVSATYPNAVANPEAVSAGNGKSKMTCYIKSCGSNDLKLSNNRKSCEKTQEKKKADREADKQLEKNQKQSDEVKKIVSEIESATKNITIGSSVSIPTKFFDNNEQVTNDSIDNAFSKWESACDKIKTSEITSTTTKEEKIINNYKFTCIIHDCDEEKGLKPSNDKKSCVKTDAQKKADKEAEKNQKAIDKQLEKNQKQSDEVKKIVSEIENASKNITIGSSVNVPTKFFDQNEQVTNDSIDNAFSKWESACGKIRTSEITSTTTKEEKIINNYKFTCIIQDCDEKKGLKPSNDGKSCVKTDAQKKADKEAEKQAKKEQKEEEKAEKDLQKALEKIQNTPATIGAKISFHADIADKDEIIQAFSDWREECKQNTSEGALEIDTDTKGSTTEKRVKTCLIIKCDEDNGYEVADNGKSCKKTKEQKKREKQEAKEEKQRKKEEQREEDKQVAIENSDENWDESDDEDVTEFKNMIAKITAAFDAATKDKKEEYCKSKREK